MKQQVIFASFISFAILSQANGHAQTVENGLEAQPVLAAVDLVPAGLVKSGNHTLAGPVRFDGYRAVFEIESPQGKFQAAGRELLSLRISELPAIENLRRVNKGEAFTDALAKAAKAPLDFVGNVLTDPGATLGNVASGVGRLIESAGGVLRSGLDNVADGVSDMGSASSKPVETSDEQEPPSFISDPFGYNKARRQWAKSLAVDPYTSNPLLRQLLDDAASATFAGSFAVDTTLGIVAAPVKFAVGFDKESQDVVWDMSPGDIQAQVEVKLKNMGIEGRPVRDFFRNNWVTPTLQASYAAVLEKLGNVGGRASAIDMASKTQGEAKIRGLIEVLSLIADHHQKTAPLDDLRVSNAMAVATRRNGELVAAIGADYLYWNAAAAELASRADLTAPRRTLLVSGKASSLARQELERAGWVLVEHGLVQAGPEAAATGR